ncbi:uncharacterized protein OCT59_016446 [Rhizophagus irregularis]|uniref:uncharacterized protein n=1 Tax=Rhizophagus irregularis TaxID=588596 RepID=UPI0033258DB6|nr:hypothetical protein OCT59_016446 [Rhizophagus irregularis]
MNIIDYSLTLSEIPYDNYCYYPITSDLSTISDVSISSISNALSDNNNSSEIPYDNYCYYPITSDLSTISDASISNVSISSISNALSDKNNSSEIPHDNYLITSDLSTIISNALSNHNNSSEIPYDNYPITSDLSTIISNAFSDNNNSSEIPYHNYPITSNLSTISDVSISSILSDNNNSSEIPYDNYCYYPITSDLSTITDASISDVSISSISNALSDNNNSSEIPYDNYCYYPITSDLSTITDASISDVSISSISNALSDNNNSSEIPYDNYPITSNLSTISDASISDVSISSISNASISDASILDASISDEQPIVQSSRPTDHKHKIRIFTLESLTDLLNGVRISFDGNHNDMTQSWSQEELNVRRRVVQFFNIRAKKRIMASFKAVDLIEQPKNGIFVSCLYWYDKKIQCDKWYFTSTDYLNLLESLTGIRLTSDEKNRIRRNLEEYKPITVGKNKNDGDEIYKDLMSYSFAKPRNVEKDIKLYEWRHLLHAVEKIINKYGKKKNNNLSLLI